MPRRKVGACVPCSTRKVACDAQRIGNPCSRCKQKGFMGLCMPAVRSVADAKRLHQNNAIPSSEPELDGQRPQISAERTPNDDVAAFEKPIAIITEHDNNYNPYVLLGDAFGQARRPGLVLPEYPNDFRAMERELSLLDDIDKKYLHQKKVYDMPAKQTSDELIALFFEHVYQHFPVLNCSHFMSRYLQGTCSTILLYSLYAAVVPYTSARFVHDLGFVTTHEAQKEFFSRAKLLYDLDCESSELALLQGSVLLCSFIRPMEQSKDFRFWKSNATRLATQMGLYKLNICNVLAPPVYELYRRIWWTVVQLDVSSVISGLEESRFIHDGQRRYAGSYRRGL
ncbi:hypothetical protein EJ08DRAFT_461948 [Tothia fuscella]|uniref:Zn(2)-C6 fungal-type domain-containing protein n=1 Tax=Tothia fuscella TaxID=1048955 RepID=A0A9P4NIV5_9PEZI|nr:hypothetical protein EJ08DRAFT_461948 [Tothia fuscella]